jgi:hypothetical protein
MSIMRCKDHAPRRATRDYVGVVEPVGYPETALVCGSKHCRAPALIWLERHEKADYDAGERVFEAFTATMKVRAK